MATGQRPSSRLDQGRGASGREGQREDRRTEQREDQGSTGPPERRNPGRRNPGQRKPERSSPETTRGEPGEPSQPVQGSLLGEPTETRSGERQGANPGVSWRGAVGAGSTSAFGAASPSAFAERREERLVLVEELRAQGIRDPRVLAAMARVPRHAFVPAAEAARAYENTALPLAVGQTVSQPFIVASMTEQARLTESGRCLEVGTGSGYQAAVLAEVCRKVWTIEYFPELAAGAERTLRGLGYGPDRIELCVGDGRRGWPEAAPWDAILVTAAPAKVPRPLLEQLALGGRLVIPVGDVASSQWLEVWQRVAPGIEPGAFRRETLYGVRFVPLLGESPN